MPQFVAGVVARPQMGGPLASHIERVANAMSSALELTRPQDQERAIHWVLLSLVLIAAAIVRFWGLGSVGLHGDEETMAMAVRGILEQGAPILPSGMFYPRGLTQLALMSVSVSVFGESEWALRLPSAICGIVLVAVGYFAGRRFLRPSWALVLAATLALLPELIIYSQTARMYIFLVTFIATAMVCVFAWERTGRLGWLLGAIVALIFGLEMHSLAIASVLMLMLPGVAQGDARKLLVGVAAMLAVGIGFVTIETFVNAQYPDPPSDLFGGPSVEGLRASVEPTMPLGIQVALWIAGLALGLIALRLAARVSTPPIALLTAALLLAAIVLQLMLFYHLAGLFYVAGFVAAARHAGRATAKGLAIVAAGALAIAVGHALLVAPEAGTFIRLVGALNGQPSSWPYARIAEFSIGAAIVCAALLAWGLWRIARRLPVPEYWVLAVLGVWAPIFALGLFAWDSPSRYTAMSLLPLLICAIAFAQMGFDRLRARLSKRLVSDGMCAALIGIFVINPVATARTVDAGYRIHPDHRGAADFMRAQGITDADVVLAEDVLQQTFYLGRVDYWLIGPNVARRFVMKTDAGIVDFYTATPVIVTPEMLDKLLRDNRDKRIFIVGSGEDWVRGRRTTRGALHEALQSDRFETVYFGRDGLTRVLRALPPRQPITTPQPSEARSRAELERRAEEALEEAAPASPTLQ